MSNLIATTPERNGRFQSVEYQSGRETGSLLSDLREEERNTALRLLVPSQGNELSLALPVLATASDVREVVQFLKKKPDGVTLVEALSADRQRIFDPRKVSAYEFWGIVVRTNDRLKLSPIGWEFARQMEPEMLIYRQVLNNAEPYCSVLEWIHRQDMQLVTHADVADYWQEHHTETLEQHDEKTVERNVVCFFNVCQAAGLGTLTIGKKGQRARFRIEADELHHYIEAGPSTCLQPATVERARIAAPGAHAASNGREVWQTRKPVREFAGKLRLFVSCGARATFDKQLQAALELADIECRIMERTATEGALIPAADALQVMQQCEAALIVVTDEDGKSAGEGCHTLNENILLEIGAALALYQHRVMLLQHQRFPLSINLPRLRCYKIEGDELTWEEGLQLLRAIKDLKDGSQTLTDRDS